MRETDQERVERIIRESIEAICTEAREADGLPADVMLEKLRPALASVLHRLPDAAVREFATWPEEMLSRATRLSLGPKILARLAPLRRARGSTMSEP